jgi:sugar phosphate isomerase/epimerase
MTRSAIQSHTLRGLDERLPRTIRRVGAAGYDGIELAGRFASADPGAVRLAAREAGVEIVAAHVDRHTLQEETEAVLDRCERVGCERIVLPHRGPGEILTDRLVRELADELNRLGRQLDERGFDLLYHNGPYDLRPTFGEPGLGSLLTMGPLPNLLGRRATELLNRLTPHDPERLFDRTPLGRIYALTDADTLGFELDVGWIEDGGYDPGTVLNMFGDRLPLVHLTEGSDVDATMAAARRNGVEWVVFENDHPESPLETLRSGARTLASAAAPTA